jgi:hypothetical protein
LAAAGLLLLGACATTPPEPEIEDRPDARALAIKTTVTAQSATIVLAERWRAKVKLKALAKRPGDDPAVASIVATGSATFDLLGLHVEANEIELRYMDDPAHEDLVLHARNVKAFRQDVEFGHRTENVDAVTMANDQVHIFNQ